MEKEIELLEVPLGKSANITVEDCDENLITQNRSQFDNCPGCNNFWDLEMINCTMDDPAFIVLCRPCQWMAQGETIEQAMFNWNRRNATAREARLVEALEIAYTGFVSLSGCVESQCRQCGAIAIANRESIVETLAEYRGEK